MVAAEETLNALFHELGDGICVVEKGGRIIYINPSARDMLGLSESAECPASLCQGVCAKLVERTDEDFAKTCPLVGATNPHAGLTLEGTWPHVSYDWAGFHIQKREQKVQLRVRCLRWPDHPFGPSHADVHFVIIQDVTRESEVQRHKEEWRDMAAHDLRSPLTNIFGALRVLQEVPEGRPLDKGERQLVEIGARSCRRMIELLDLYLDIAKLDASKMPVDMKPQVLLDEVWACVEEQQPFIQERGVKVAIDVDENLRVQADRDLLPRVIQNLLNNAVKFSPAGGDVTVSASRQEDGRIVLSVQDRGPGIAPEDIPLLFDRFHQAKARQAGKTQGTGLGLTFCREAMRAMHGEIDVESRPRSGSRFFLTLTPAQGEP